MLQISVVGPKNLAIPVHFTSSPRPTPRRKKCSRTNEKSPNCQETKKKIEITEGKCGTPPKAAFQSVPRESTSAMSQP